MVERVIIDEKILEDFLEKHLSQLEPDLRLIGRQYETLSGPIDLFARDKYGNYVIIELKKGRASDRVVGQVSRYVSDISCNLAPIKKISRICTSLDLTLLNTKSEEPKTTNTMVRWADVGPKPRPNWA